jgi:prevent-host-death family protein
MEVEMARKMSATEARVHFGEVIRRVTEGNETIIVERGGIPAAVVISAARFEELKRSDDEAIHPSNQAALHWLESWMGTPDEMGATWWNEFEQEIREHPVRFGATP